MRVIKFRTWDRASKFMFCIFDSESQVEWFLPQVKARYAIMQFTGLTDCHGKEIFEGDLIRNATGRICEVTWHDFTGGWDATVRKAAGDDNGFAPQKWQEEVEVIGNIYENPELLK